MHLGFVRLRQRQVEYIPAIMVIRYIVPILREYRFAYTLISLLRWGWYEVVVLCLTSKSRCRVAMNLVTIGEPWSVEKKSGISYGWIRWWRNKLAVWVAVALDVESPLLRFEYWSVMWITSSFPISTRVNGTGISTAANHRVFKVKNTCQFH